MKKEDDYVSGPHKYWTHFWFGLIFGSLFGAWIFNGVFHQTGWIIIGALSFGVGAAFACARWGDKAWERMMSWLPWF